MSRVYNFSAGPAMLPVEVLQEAAAEMLDYKGTGMGVMEMSHRSKAYQQIIDEAEKDLRELMNIPDHYKVLFLQGGAQVVLETGGHLFGGELAVGGVDLHAVSAHFGSDGERFLPRKAERFEHNAKMKLFHGDCLLYLV